MSNGSGPQMDCEDFLDLVWGNRSGWIDLPAKVGQYWVPFHAEWPEDEAAVTRRIDSSIRDRESLYFSVAQYQQRGRRIEDVLATHWLWADLDEVHPTDGAKLGLLPSIAWESSPGRYQALWRLSGKLRPRTAEKLNRALTYALDADRGGWDLTQVLRLPGTRNWKYPGGPMVKLLWVDDTEYEPASVWRTLKATVGVEELEAATTVVIPRRGIPGKAKRLLRTPVDQVVEGERSHRLWELECMLAEAGLSETEIFNLVWPSAWNKWQGINTGRARLGREIRKALQHVRRRSALAPSKVQDGTPGKATDADSPKPDGGGDGDGGFPWISYPSFMAMSMEEPKWLIEDIWVAGSHGIVGGEPKTQKTTLALAMALAVASGTPMLGRWRVGRPGPVLMVQEENDPWMIQDRLRKLAAYMGLISTSEASFRPAGAGGLGDTVMDLEFPVDLPLKLLNNYGFDLAVEEHRDMLWAEVESFKPALVILDPLYLILGSANENQSSELRPFLQWLLRLRYDLGTAVAVIHHMRKVQAKGPVVRPGQRLMGNATLHGWVDSAIYTDSLDEDRAAWTKARMHSEFRSMPPQEAIEIAIHFDEPGSLGMELELEGFNWDDDIFRIATREPGITVNALAERLSLDKRTVLARCRGSETVEVRGGKKGRGHSWRVYGRNGDGAEA